MRSEDDHSDADHIALGLDLLRGDRLLNLNDLCRVLEQLGREMGDRIATIVWDFVDWSCPLDDCKGGLEPVDTRVRGHPDNADDLWELRRRRPGIVPTPDRG